MQAELLEPHRRHLWGLCYRLTGSPADADDLVQQTFLRALERPPVDLTRDLKPWLTKVALNLGRDTLRRRKARSYVGVWLPAPIETGDEPASAEARLSAAGDTAGRYDLMESVSLAFLVALEALGPKQRAVLLLRDVFDYSGAQAAEALDLSVADVKVSLHRARKKMAQYDSTRPPAGADLTAQTREALGRMLAALGAQDLAAVQALLAEQAEAFTDGGGEFLSAMRPVRGGHAVARFLLGLAKKRPITAIEPCELNHRPGLRLRYAPRGPRDAPEATVSLHLDGAGRVRAIYSVSASAKLARTRADGA